MIVANTTQHVCSSIVLQNPPRSILYFTIKIWIKTLTANTRIKLYPVWCFCGHPCLLLRLLLPLLFVTCNCFTYVAEERTWTYSKYISRDRYPDNLLARRSDYRKHVTWSLPTALLRTRKTQLPLLFRDLATDCLPRICLRGNLFTNMLPGNGCTCNNIN
jgi:hypothetical protein